jgi:DNA-binding NtrC family response regulator
MCKPLYSFLASLPRRLHGNMPAAKRQRDGADEGMSKAPAVIVALVIDEADRTVLTGAAARNPWVLHFADTYAQAWATLNHLKAPIILCDRRLSGEDWRDVVYMMALSPHHACAILLSHVVDDYLWNEVIRVGGYDVLSTPLREDELVRSVRLAWSYWNTAAKVSPLRRKQYR